jgi:hypothetical protein
MPALAQDSYSPSNVICDVVNFGFCDQGRPSTSPPPDVAPEFVPPPIDKKAETPPSEKHKKVAQDKKTPVKKVKSKVSPEKAAD